VSEIEDNLQLLIRKSPDIDVSSLPLRAKYYAALKGNAKLILVFTQERLHLLTNVIGDAVGIDLLLESSVPTLGQPKP
jgi:hypothetical protein